MKALLDNNIIIQRELDKTVSQDILTLYRWLEKGKYTRCIHPITIKEIEKLYGEDLVKKCLSEQNKYEIIKSYSSFEEEIRFVSEDYDKTDNDSNDSNDSILLNEVLHGNVDILISNNNTTHSKADALNIQDKVFTIDSFLEKVFAEHPELVNYKVLNVQKLKFNRINLNDAFFNNLREDYSGFNEWFHRKNDEEAYITINSNNGLLLSFLYLKVESTDEDYSNISPVLPPKKRLKIGTFKVISNGFRLGERFLKIVFDNALKNKVDEIYVTIFNKRDEQKRLISLLEQWGFVFGV